ncbi:PREDICTED: palmitoyltransferase ZDHHC6-like [Amphimedon queenslandica]|uniref:Palmitoyltransferase n=1 Tax=Amphimedon queenslandica TaxID=400682 RepID=A0A1X7TV95_AMPQE|nr:PREDICTED: palmitoyltransferase ZDHHC6-like [Amphimedon queenslandica]|eukprot:XP_003389771.1 PREDICTED: palmitoyltransferase ZDHHC6-like [Amphimedon queenslandica]
MAPSKPRSVIRQLCHWGPIVALSLIGVVVVSATYSSIQLYSLPSVKYIKKFNFFTMYLNLWLILYSYFKAFGGPGFVPIKWKPSNEADKEYLQYCDICQAYKAPRSHHCSSCGRCVLKMDHHCPWINCCVGHRNQNPFIAFLFFLPVGCIYATILNSNFLYRLFSYEFRGRAQSLLLPINSYTIMLTISGIAFSLGAALGVCILLYVQLSSVLSNRTQIEDWICEKAATRRRNNQNLKPFVYPYDLGRSKNWKQVIRCSFTPVGDGIYWPVVKGCNQYSFTIEQMAQKVEKKKRGVDCKVTRDFNGSCLKTLVSYGPLVFICTPCLEPSIPISKNDIITITRFRKRWVYGNKHIPQEEINEGKRVRGWIPRLCVLKENSTQLNKVSLPSSSLGKKDEDKATEKEAKTKTGSKDMEQPAAPRRRKDKNK